MVDCVIQEIELINGEEFQPLLQASLEEGYPFLQKLWDEYQSGANRFDAPGALILGGYVDDILIAIGGIHIDPYINQPTVGRIRHVYVLPDYRRSGVGKRLMNTLIDHARSHFEILTLRTPTAHGDAFYRAIGFSIEPRFAEATHWMRVGKI